MLPKAMAKHGILWRASVNNDITHDGDEDACARAIARTHATRNLVTLRREVNRVFVEDIERPLKDREC